MSTVAKHGQIQLYIAVNVTKYTCTFMYTCALSLSWHCAHAKRNIFPIVYCMIRCPIASHKTVNRHPMLTTSETLMLTCTAMHMGTPHPQVDWYNGDRRITSSSRIQINKSEIDDSTTPMSAEWRAVTAPYLYSTQWLSMSVWFGVLLYTWYCHVLLLCMHGWAFRLSHTGSKLRA